MLFVFLVVSAHADNERAFRTEIEPLLKEFCYDCHADGANKGGVALDQMTADFASPAHREVWAKALQNVRSGLMPPPKKPQPTLAQKGALAQWIKSAALEIDPENPDPGRVTVRRLNRVEYRNTIRDLLGLDFNTDAEFPADDTGHGFDNIGDVLTLPTMLLEKYLTAARTIATKSIPVASGVPAEQTIPGKNFRKEESEDGTKRDSNNPSALTLSYYEPATVTNRFKASQGGQYQLILDLTANERFVDNQFDYNKCRLIFRVDGKELLRQDYTREGGRSLRYQFDQKWENGDHELNFEIVPLTPDQERVRSLTLRINTVTVRGPLEPQHWVRPVNYARFFPKEAPTNSIARRAYAREILGKFARQAFRRPVEEEMLDRLVALAESTYEQPGKTFEAGFAQAVVAILASPRFLFREEEVDAAAPGGTHPWVDQYALASRLSYFLWSSQPDEELLRLADERKLRENVKSQVQRMLADPRSDALVKNFVGQWLQLRDVETVVIDARQVLAREAPPDPDGERRRRRFRELRDKEDAGLTPEEKQELASIRTNFFRGFRRPLRAELNGELRRAMRLETEKVFARILEEDRSLREVIDSDYTFLNERLARHYGITNVVGDEMQLISLPEDSPRGGILTHGSVLTVTSNPTRTSPVKRGLFLLDNILGTPPPPPPPDIPPLEDAAKEILGRTPSLRETLALHREKPLCSSCHNRMDPLGLALENFNAMGMFRDKERGEAIDATGQLITGEKFNDIRELKRILVRDHARDFYHTITEKLLTYALGRGLEYYDVETVDRIVDRLEKADGHPSALLLGIVESVPFQKTRLATPGKTSKVLTPATERADSAEKP